MDMSCSLDEWLEKCAASPVAATFAGLPPLPALAVGRSATSSDTNSSSDKEAGLIRAFPQAPILPSPELQRQQVSAKVKVAKTLKPESHISLY
jgi:hypothetical protein